MDKREEKLQLEKIELIQRMVLLLEEIAHLLSRGFLEKDKYLEGLYASRIPGAAAVHGDMRAQSATREGSVSKPESCCRVQRHADKGAAETQKTESKNDTGGLKKYYDGSI